MHNNNQMSIQRPSQNEIERFMLIQQGKKFVGDWYSPLPYILAASLSTAALVHTLYWSMSPSGIVPRILYEKSLSLPRRHFRHFLPALVLVGSLFSYDYYQGLWSEKI